MKLNLNENLFIEDTKKKTNGKWVNKGSDGEHGEFKTKKEADAQRKAMFANGFHEELEEPAAIRNTTVKCSQCGNEFELWDEYLGACECPKCGQWYNLFGQEVKNSDILNNIDESLHITGDDLKIWKRIKAVLLTNCGRELSEKKIDFVADLIMDNLHEIQDKKGKAKSAAYDDEKDAIDQVRREVVKYRQQFESLEKPEELTEKYSGWAQEDIELFESIDWAEQGDEDYDAGFAYLDSAVLYDPDNIERVNTEFHKFFKNDPYSKPYYKPVDARPFDNKTDYIGPISKGDTYRDYDVYNQYDRIIK